ncbi:response regulator [Ekhidna sp.]|uniref:response regulator n=1 Tax=Ekhidna sp. TaxID=2608089 RepID=UPI0032ECE5B0
MEKPTILYVDDDQFNITLFEFNFKNEFEILNATSGSEALDLIKNHDEIRAIVSDVRMPEMDGIEFITKVKETRESLPCFLLTGYGGAQEVVDAIDQNLIVGYFSKPFDKENIITTLKSTINE